MQWLGLDKSMAVPINLDIIPRFLDTSSVGETLGKEIANVPAIRKYMLDGTASFIGELIRRNDSVLKIADSNFAYLNEPLAAHYGVPGVKGITLRPVPIKPAACPPMAPCSSATARAPRLIRPTAPSGSRDAIRSDEVAPPPADVPALTDTAGESSKSAFSISDLLSFSPPPTRPEPLTMSSAMARAASRIRTF